MAPRASGLPPHKPRARAQTKTFHSPRPLRALGHKWEETRVPLAPSHEGKKLTERADTRARAQGSGLAGSEEKGERGGDFFGLRGGAQAPWPEQGLCSPRRNPRAVPVLAAHARRLISGALFRWVARVGFGRRRSRSPTFANRRSGLCRCRVASSIPRSHILHNAAPGRPRRAHESVLRPQRLHGPLRCPPLGASGAVSAAAAASPVPGRRRGVPGGRPGLARHAAAAAAAALGHGSRRDCGRSSADPAAAPLSHCLGQDGAGEQVPARTHGREGLARPVLHSRHAVADGR